MTTPEVAFDDSGRPPVRAWRRVGVPLMVLRLVGQGGEFLGFVVLARHLAPSRFGTLSVAFLICRYAGLLADWGASVRGARHVAAVGHAGSVHALIRRRYLVTGALSVVYVAVVLALGEPALVPLVVTIANRGASRDWIALGQEQGTRAGLPSSVQGALVLGGSFAARTVATASGVIAVGYGVGAVVSIAANRLPIADNREPVPTDAWMLTAVMADQVTASTDTVLLAGLRSSREAGIYAAVYRIPNAWITVIGLVIIGFVPAATRALRDDPTALDRLRRRAVRTGLASGAGVALTIPPSVLLVPLVFGHAYRSGQGPLAVLLLATAVNAAAAPLHPVYLALARDRSLALASSAAAGLNLAANLIVIPIVGMMGAASTTLAAQVALLLFFWFASQPRDVRTA